MQKELASCKVQLEAKEYAYMQSLLKLQHYEERIGVLSGQLMKSELERDVSMGELREARGHIKELELKLKEICECLSEAENTHQHLLNNAVNQAEEMEILANVEKEKSESLLKHVEELDETIYTLKAAALEAETEKSRILSEKDAKVEFATSVALRMQEELDRMERRLDFIRELETQVLKKSTTIDSLQSHLKDSDFTISSLKEDIARATKDVEELKGELEAKEQEASNRAVYIEMLEVELNQLKEMVTKPNKDNHLSHEEHEAKEEYHSSEIELSELEDQATGVQAEIAMLKAELHQTRLRLEAAEAEELKAEGIRSGLYLAVQQLAAEAEEVKNENERLKQAVETERGDPLKENPTSVEASSAHAADKVLQEKICEEEEEARVIISLEEYEGLLLKAKKADDIPARPAQNSDKHETEILTRDLEVAQAKVGEFRTRVEHALARAEAAEKALTVLEEQMSRRRDKKHRRKAALAALQEASITRESPTRPPREDGISTVSSPGTPLWKVLNMRYY
ncbi:hypothetical protein MLD38_031903 [Melastoma candidum]|nr:hypothetical protein MLD38_031903 [Melastoma candidum]